MSISIRNESGSLNRVAGFSDVDQVLSPTSINPIQNRSVYNALAQKIEKTVTDLINYYDKSQVYNKTEVRELIGAINTLTIEVVPTLPTTDISSTTIYFVGPATGTNNYDEYVYVGSSWVKIGDTEIDLSSYVTSTQLTTILQSYYTKTEIDNLLNSYYTKTATDALLDAKQNALTFDDVPTAGSNNPVKSSGIKTALDGKQAALTFDTVPVSGSSNPVTSNGIYNATTGVYKYGDAAETTIENNDYFPMYDTSAGVPKKTLWSTIVNKFTSTFMAVVNGFCYGAYRGYSISSTNKGAFKITYPIATSGSKYNMKTFDCTLTNGYSSGAGVYHLIIHHFSLYNTSTGHESNQGGPIVLMGYPANTGIKVYWQEGAYYVTCGGGYSVFSINHIHTADSGRWLKYEQVTLDNVALPSSGVEELTVRRLIAT